MNKRKIAIGISISMLLICSIFIMIFYNSIANWLLTSYSKSNFRNILEIIYFLTSPLLLVVAIIGLRQLTITKETNKLNATRESYTFAAEQCKYYFEYIVPLVNNLNELMKNNGIKNFGEAKVISTNKSIEMQYKLNTNEKVKDLVPKIAEVLNALEGFSIFFASKVAEESVAFSSVGHTFVKTIERYLPIICATQKVASYANIMKLYILWKDRFEKQEAIMKKNEAENKLNQECIIKMKSLGT